MSPATSGDHWQMQQCFNVFTDINKVFFMVLFHCCILLEIKLTTITTNVRTRHHNGRLVHKGYGTKTNPEAKVDSSSSFQVFGMGKGSTRDYLRLIEDMSSMLMSRDLHCMPMMDD